MKKKDLKDKTTKKITETKEALELIISCITAKGQRKKIARNPEAKALLDCYGVDIDA